MSDNNKIQLKDQCNAASDRETKANEKNEKTKDHLSGAATAFFILPVPPYAFITIHINLSASL